MPYLLEADAGAGDRGGDGPGPPEGFWKLHRDSGVLSVLDGRMRKLILIAVVAAFAAVPTVSALASSPPKKVTVGNNFFSNKKMTVKRGTKVTWVWHSFGLAHNVTVKSGPVQVPLAPPAGERVVQPRVHARRAPITSSARCTRRR